MGGSGIISERFQTGRNFKYALHFPAKLRKKDLFHLLALASMSQAVSKIRKRSFWHRSFTLSGPGMNFFPADWYKGRKQRKRRRKRKKQRKKERNCALRNKGKEVSIKDDNKDQRSIVTMTMFFKMCLVPSPENFVVVVVAVYYHYKHCKQI